MTVDDMVGDLMKAVNFGYPQGLLESVSEGDWRASAERLVAVRSAMPLPSGSFDQEHLWFLPMVMTLTRVGLIPSAVVDIACGMSIPMWYSHVLGQPTSLFGLDMSPCPTAAYPPGATVIKCQLLDPNSVRSGIMSCESVGGLMVATEWLEHVEYNPIPTLTIISERVRPDIIYFSAPNFTNHQTFMRPEWVHYSTLAGYRGQPIRYAPWHHKGWTFNEMADLIDDLGYNLLAGYSGYHCSGICGIPKPDLWRR